MVEKVKGGWLDFDVAVATPDMMKDVGRLGPVLGRRGLMPNPKTQTVTFNIKEAINELQKGRVEFRSDKTGVLHLAVGKVSNDIDKIIENIRVVISEVERKKPADTKGELILTAAVSSTMGPGVKVANK
jgi:large subunit ribosomal protein L1